MYIVLKELFCFFSLGGLQLGKWSPSFPYYLIFLLSCYQLADCMTEKLLPKYSLGRSDKKKEEKN